MPYYNYRILYVSFIAIVLVGWFCGDLWPLCKQMTALHATENTLSAELLARKNALAAMPDASATVPTATQRMTDLFMLARDQQVVVQSLHWAKSETDEVVVRVVVTGNFARIAAFINTLGEQKYPIINTDFSFIDSGERAALDLVLLTTPLPVSSVMAASIALQNPFCHANTTQETTAAKLQSVPLAALKMLGYIKQYPRKYAFILLPSNEVVTVALGTLVGQERAVVTAIEAEQVLLVTPDKQRWVLKK